MIDVQEKAREISSWKTIRRWIADMVSIEPTIMRRVSHRKFGDLGSWLEKGSVGYCGCLVGTTALELVRARNSFKPTTDTYFGEAEFVRTKDTETEEKGDACDAADIVEELSPFASNMKVAALTAGMAAIDLQYAVGQDEAVALIKDEIRKQLLLRAKHIRGGLKRARAAKRKSDGTFKAA